MIRAIFALLFISALNAQSAIESTLESNPQIAESSAKQNVDLTNDSITSPPPPIRRILPNLN